jgi:LysM repeat protein
LPTIEDDQPQSSQISVYTVRTGDTLSDIATMFNVTANTIIWANDIKGRVIHPGDMLIILPVSGIRHTVAKARRLPRSQRSTKAI